jgi:hypothetical protein
MKARKRNKSTKTLKRGKKLEKTKTLLTIPLTDVHITGNQTGGHEPPPPPPNP